MSENLACFVHLILELVHSFLHALFVVGRALMPVPVISGHSILLGPGSGGWNRWSLLLRGRRLSKDGTDRSTELP